jgi:hypothetical protein
MDKEHEYEKDLTQFDLWNMVYERDRVINRLTKVMSQIKSNRYSGLVQLLDSAIHDRNEMEEISARVCSAVPKLIAENQHLRHLTKHFTVSTPKQ